MAIITGAIYFCGEYRPAYFHAESVNKLNTIMQLAVRNVKDAEWFVERISQAAMELKSRNCAAYCCDHGARGVSMAKREHDPFLDTTTAKFPHYPGLDYSMVCNAA